MIHFAYMPSRIPRQVLLNLFARTIPPTLAFPRPGTGRPLHYAFRGLLSVYSRYGLHARQVAFATLCTRGFSSLVASTAALIATGWSEPVPGRVTPAVDHRLFTAHPVSALIKTLVKSVCRLRYTSLIHHRSSHARELIQRISITACSAAIDWRGGVLRLLGAHAILAPQIRAHSGGDWLDGWSMVRLQRPK